MTEFGAFDGIDAVGAFDAIGAWVRVDSGRPEQAMIEAEVARIVADLTVRVLPDPGDGVIVEFFCNVKPA